MSSELAQLRQEFDLPSEFSADVLAAADAAARRDPFAGHVDRTDEVFRTLDPATSTDLDQAFSIEYSGAPDDPVMLHYAIADVGHFVDPDGPIAEEAWRRGTTFYLPDGRIPLYPPVLCEAAASLLPDGPRPAVIFRVLVDSTGEVTLDGVERAVIHSRAKLAYTDINASSTGLLGPGFAELSRRIVAAEDRRGAPRVEFPSQLLVRENGRWALRFDARLESEDLNAGMSLATNLAVADALVAARTGLFRVMPDVDDRAVHRLRLTARAMGLHWPADQSLAVFERSIDTADPKGAAFLLAVRRAAGGASYEPYADGVTPWHSAMAATYTHATAPLRRLADRYVIDGALAIVNGDPLPDYVAKAYQELPAVMAEAAARAGQVESAAFDLAEAVLLVDRVGEIFDGVVVDEDSRGVRVQIGDPAVLVRIDARRVDPGDDVRVKLVAADPTSRRVEFTRVG